jgi:hypothetical protein
MPTVAEILKQSGWTDEKIAALDAGAITAFTGVLNTAEAERKAAAEEAAKAAREKADAVAAKEAAELEKRSTTEFWETKVMPGLTAADEKEKALAQEIANSKALAAFYREQNESARTNGFIPQDAPGFKPEMIAPNQPQRGPDGKYLPNQPGGTPGSPSFVAPEDVVKRASDAFSVLSNIQWEYQSLHGGQPMPISPTTLVAEADAQKLSPYDYAARKFNFEGKRQELAAKAKEEEAARIRTEAVKPYEEKLKQQEIDANKRLEEEKKKWAETSGSNPDVRRAEVSSFAEIKRAVQAGERPDPLSMNKVERHNAMRKQIQEDVGKIQEDQRSAVA